MPIIYRGFEINAEGDPAWAQREIDFHKDVIDFMLDSQGAQGDQGDQGDQGAGEQGDQGTQGTQGTQGAQGSAGGEQGDQGDQGAQGFQGDGEGNMVYKEITKTGQSAGNLNLSDGTTWAISKAQIDYISVQMTAGTANKFSIDVYEDDTFSGDIRYAVENVKTSDGWTDDIEWIYTDDDDTDEIHIKLTETGGTGTYTIHLRGIKLV